jgi:predicted signal transduction protein with EAL and GGDEF domain
MMSESLNLKTVAEGIEHLEQSETLQNLGCGFGQGYYFSKPLSKIEMDEFLLKAGPNGELNYLISPISQETMTIENLSSLLN